MPAIEQAELRKKEFVILRNSQTGDVLKVIFPNGIQVGIPGIDTFNKGMILPNRSEPPQNTQNLLYAQNGDIYFNGLLVAPSAGSNLTIKDEGIPLTTTVASINFVGSGITATNVGNNVTVTTEADSENQILASQIFG
jgi:hypothetical protein